MSKVFLRVNAVEYIDWQPGFLRCELVDRHGMLHTFVEKVPVICGADTHYNETSIYPVEITFTGEMMEEMDGGKWYKVSTKIPYDISSEEGINEFEVGKEQIIR